MGTGRDLRGQKVEEVGHTLIDAPTSTRVDSRRRGVYERLFKRGLDIVMASALIIALSPVIIAVGIGVLFTMGTPVIFRQQRLGRNAQPFLMLKFRTMRPDRRNRASFSVETDRRLTHKTDADPRHTKFGRFLRHTSLDELPQLWNVMRGDMSLVGPRPELPAVAEKHGFVDHPRHSVRPGITGAWQVSDYRSSLLHENLHLDVEYVQRMTATGDLKILFKTFGALSRPTGA